MMQYVAIQIQTVDPPSRLQNEVPGPCFVEESRAQVPGIVSFTVFVGPFMEQISTRIAIDTHFLSNGLGSFRGGMAHPRMARRQLWMASHKGRHTCNVFYSNAAPSKQTVPKAKPQKLACF